VTLKQNVAFLVLPKLLSLTSLTRDNPTSRLLALLVPQIASSHLFCRKKAWQSSDAALRSIQLSWKTSLREMTPADRTDHCQNLKRAWDQNMKQRFPEPHNLARISKKYIFNALDGSVPPALLFGLSSSWAQLLLGRINSSWKVKEEQSHNKLTRSQTS
jgi:hypothetical protein